MREEGDPDAVGDDDGDAEGRKKAFCLLLYRAHGGVVRDDYRIDTSSNEAIPGLCRRPSDCDTCKYMRQEISFHDPREVTWVCSDCLGKIIKWSKQYHVNITVPGHYTEGLCQYPWCTRAQNDLTGDPPKFSMFLQVVFGAIRPT